MFLSLSPRKIRNKNIKILATRIFILTVVLFLVGILTSTQLFSEEIDDLNKQINSITGEKNSKEKVLKGATSQINAIKNSSASAAQKIKQMDDLLAQMDLDMKSANDQINAKKSEMDEKMKKVEEKDQSLRIISKKMYQGSRFTTVDMLFSNHEDGVFRSFMIKKFVAKRQNDEMKILAGEKASLEAENKELELLKADLVSQKVAIDEARALLESERAAYQLELKNRIAQQQILQQEIAQMNSQLTSLNGTLQAAIRNKAATSNGQQTGGGNSGGGGSNQTPSSNGMYDIYVDGNLAYQGANDPIRVTHGDQNNVLRVNGSLTYRGVIEFRADSNMFAINELPVELYLRGIAEMPSSWTSEALKSQSVAARTYLAKNWNKRTANFYNLRDDPFDQNYTGYQKEAEANYGQNWVNAVNGTTNQVISQGGSLISAYYHSTCGGHTLNSEDVWVSALPYARAKSDWFNDGGTWKSYDRASPWAYKKWGTGTIDNNIMADLINATIYLQQDYNNSQRQLEIRPPSQGGLSAEEIRNRLGGQAIQSRLSSITNVQSIYNGGKMNIDQDTSKTEGVRISGPGAWVDLSGDTFWVVFNARSPNDLTIYYSNLWTSVNEGGSWNFYSRGYPHRVGMCQYGANGRAQAGQSYVDILNHYYNGIQLTNFSPPSNARIGITRIPTGDNLVTSLSGATLKVYANGNEIAWSNGSVRVVKR